MARVHIVRGHSSAPALFDALDLLEADLATVGVAVLDMRTGELTHEAEAD